MGAHKSGSAYLAQSWPDRSDQMTFLAWWGACLSTFLAVVKLWEIWRDRFRLDISYNFTSLPEIGNDIFVRNLTASPIILSSWELLWFSGRWPFWKQVDSLTPPWDAGDTRIEAHSSLTLTFTGQNHFDCGVKALEGRRIYLRLYIAGRRAVLRKVYG